MSHQKQIGATLIELIVGIIILGILAGLAIPSFTTFLAGSHLRAAAESVLSGVQLARAEAIRRNTAVCFYIDSSSSATSLWYVNLDDTSAGLDCNNSGKPGITNTSGGDFIQKSAANEGANITITLYPSTTANTITFNSFGKVLPSNTQTSSCPPSRIVFSAANTTQRYQIEIKTPDISCSSNATTPSGGQVRLCDPAITSTNDPRACQLS